MTATYILVSYRTYDQYYARFHGFVQGTELRWWEGPDYETDSPTDPAATIAALTHGQTAHLRLRTRLPVCGSDMFVVYRYDVPVAAAALHVQYTRWKWGAVALDIRADHQAPPAYPSGAGLQDCVYNMTLTLVASPQGSP